MDNYQFDYKPCWQLQEAKAMFSKLVQSAKNQPQIITVHGKETAVVLSMESYQKLTSHKESFVNFMEQSPLSAVEFELQKRSSGNNKMRKLEL